MSVFEERRSLMSVLRVPVLLGLLVVCGGIVGFLLTGHIWILVVAIAVEAILVIPAVLKVMKPVKANWPL